MSIEITGSIETITRKETPVTKVVAEIKSDDKNTFLVEFRNKAMQLAASMLTRGDKVRLEIINQGRFDKHGNHYNNQVVTKITRI